MASNQDDNLKDSIDALVTGIGAMNKHNEAMAQSQKRVEENTKSSGRFSRSILGKAKSLPYLGPIVVKGHAMLNASIRQGNKFQQQAQARGKNLGDYASILKGSSTSMTEGMAGHSDRLDATISQYNAGLRDNVEATRALGLYTKLTGGNEKKLNKTMRSLTMGTGASVIEQASLSNHILSLSKQFGLSSDEIASSMTGLGSQMKLLKDMDIATEMATATASLTAALGGTGMEDTAKEFVNALMGPGGDTLAGIAGIGDIRRKLEQGEGNSSELLLRGFLKVGTDLNRLGAEAKATGVGLERTTTMYRNQYKGLMAAKTGMVEFQKQADRAGLSLDEFAKKASGPSSSGNNDPINTWGAAVGRIFSPFSAMITTLQSWFFEFVAYAPVFASMIGGALAVGGTVAAVKLSAGVSGLFGKLIASIGMGAGASLTGLAGGLTALAGGLGAIAFPLAGVVIAFGIFSVALIGVAHAFNESMKGFETFGQVISRLVKEPLSNLNGLGGNLMAIAAGMTAVSIAQGLMGVGSAVASLFSGEDPMDRRKKELVSGEDPMVRRKKALEQGTEVRHKASLEKWNESLENQRMQILILETMNENLGAANEQRAKNQSGVRPSEFRKK